MRAPEREPAGGVLRVVVGRELLGERPARPVGGKPQVPIGRERGPREPPPRAARGRREARGRHAVDRRARPERSGRSARTASSIGSPERSRPSPSVTSESDDRQPGRLSRRGPRRRLRGPCCASRRGSGPRPLSARNRACAPCSRSPAPRRRARGPAGSSPRAARGSRRRGPPARRAAAAWCASGRLVAVSSAGASGHTGLRERAAMRPERVRGQDVGAGLDVVAVDGPDELGSCKRARALQSGSVRVGVPALRAPCPWPHRAEAARARARRFRNVWKNAHRGESTHSG